MAGWRINAHELSAKVHELSGETLTPEQLAVPVLIAQRIARDHWTHHTISRGDLAKVTGQALGNPRHFLHFSDRRLTALTLEAIDQLLHSVSPSKPQGKVPYSRPTLAQLRDADAANVSVQQAWKGHWTSGTAENPSAGHTQHYRNVVRGWDTLLHTAQAKQKEADDLWKDFLVSFAANPEKPDVALMEGGFRLTGLIREIGYDLFLGGATLWIGVGDTVDIRFRTLLEGAIKVFKGMKAPSQRLESATIQSCKRQGIPPPLERKFILESVRSLEEVLSIRRTDGELVSALKHPVFRDDVQELLQYIASYHKGEAAQQASEALIALESGLYEKRAAEPFGKLVDAQGEFVNPRLKAIDAGERAQVMYFLRDLGIYPTNSLEEGAVWNTFSGIWKIADQIDIDKLLFDFNKTLAWDNMNFSRFRDGSYTVRMRAILVACIALVLYHRKTILVASHYTQFGFADVANHPLLKSLKFILSGRMDGPDLSVEELEDQPRIANFRDLNRAGTKAFDELMAVSDRLWDEGIAEEAKKFVAKAFRTWKVDRAPKSHFVLTRTGRAEVAGAEAIVDDKRDMVDALGRGIVVPSSGNPLRPAKKAVNGEARLQIDETLRLLHRAIDLMEQQKVVVDLRDTDVMSDTHFPVVQADIRHTDWTRKVYYGWVKPTAAWILKKLKFLAKKVEAGELGSFLDELRQILPENSTIINLAQLERILKAQMGGPALLPPVLTERQALPRPSTPVLYSRTFHSGSEGASEPGSVAGGETVAPIYTPRDPVAFVRAMGHSDRASPPNAVLHVKPGIHDIVYADQAAVRLDARRQSAQSESFKQLQSVWTDNRRPTAARFAHTAHGRTGRGTARTLNMRGPAGRMVR